MSDAIIRRPLMSGHCNTANASSVPLEAHARCTRNGGGNRANPLKEFQPCPCACHFMDADGAAPERFECEGCGKDVIEAVGWPTYTEVNDEGEREEFTRYTHVDAQGFALGEDCAVSGNPKTDSADKTRDCSRCGAEFRPEGRERVCPKCKADDAAADAAKVDEFEALMAEFDEDDEDEDDFADLDDLEDF